MEAFAYPIEQVLKKIESIWKARFPGEGPLLENLLRNMYANYIKESDVKARVILKQRLDNVLTFMENLHTEASSNYASKLPFFSRGGSYKKGLNDTEEKKAIIIKDLQRVEHKAEYLKEKRKGLDFGESEKDLELVGREKEKEEIIDQLMLLSRSGDGASPVPVIIIAGLAGIGKTALARHVCKDKKVEQQVGLPAWVIGTNYNTFDADSIAKQAIWSVVTATSTTPSPTTEHLNIIVILDDWKVEIEDKDLKALQEKLEKYWRVEIEGIGLKQLQEKIKEDWRIEIGNQDLKALQDKFKEARPRVTAIMITTRSSCLVAMSRNVTASPVKSYALPGLNEKESASLFEKTHRRDACDNFTIAEIAGRCRGVPLAIMTIAKWLHSLRSTELTEALMHSFYDEQLLHLCFAYCSLFPQGYLFDAERLIHLWMAEGFLKPSNIPSTSSGSEQDPEEIGRGYLRDLVGRSIFQDVKEDEFGQVRSCRMHPLMHDIARFVAGRENITVDPKGHKVHQRVLRASFDLSLDFSRGIPPPLFHKAKQLRSILFFAMKQSRLPLQVDMSSRVLNNIFKSFKRLCVLDLRNLGIVAVPSSIGELKDLEYLDLSHNRMGKLPGSIAKLSKLETLKLSGCYSLKELPKNFKNLAQLKHLDIEGCLGLTRMPPEMSKLTSLQTLSTFVVSKNDPTGSLEELAKLNELRGHLEILYRNRVQRSNESRETKYLKEKQHLQRLKLKWNLGVDESLDHESVLDSLEPHSDLGVLFLVGYQGYMLSSWLTSIQFKCLVKLSLHNCPRCHYLSDQDQLPKLKILKLVRLDNLQFVVRNCDKHADFYKTLQDLTITDCPALFSWWEMVAENDIDRPYFARISKLHVHHCPKLTSMPLYPRLDMVLEGSTNFGKELVLEDSCSSLEMLLGSGSGSSLELLPDTRSTKSSSVNCSILLESLHIQNCNGLENLSNAFQHLSLLQRLTIENCAEINLDGERNQWEGLKSLRFLTLREIPNLRSLSFGDSVTTLRELTLRNCHGLTSISDSIGKITSLRRLEISKCNKLKSLPIEMKELTSLQTLLILDCALLLPRCQPETGDDWPQIRHIKHIQVK